MDKRLPAEVFPPGEYIQDELTARSWSCGLLAERLGLDAAMVERLLLGRADITPAIAANLAQVFETSAEVWLNLEERYQRGCRITPPPVTAVANA